MKPARAPLKRPSGWFAAGREIEAALLLLSDSAFRLFLWICLRAGRDTGVLEADPAHLARRLRKSEVKILGDLDELVRLQVCRVQGDSIMIQDRFWPYERPGADANSTESAYLAAIRRAFLRHACVVSSFTAADEKLAREWEHQALPVETVQRAILLGVARKYTAWLNHGAGTPITSLEYFAGVLREIQHSPASAAYGAYLERKIRTLEAAYRRRQEPPTAPAAETK
jgi:hypothetical protein